MMIRRGVRLVGALVLIVIVVSALSGCWDRKELESLAFVMALGIDKGKRGNVAVTVQIAVPSQLAPSTSAGGGGTSAGGGAAVDIETFEGRTLADVARSFNTQSGRRLNFMHTKVLVLGKDFAASGIDEAMGFFARHREIRHSMFVMVSKGKASDILEIRPRQERNPGDYLEGVARLATTTSVAPRVQLHHFFLAYESRGMDPIAPMVVVRKHRENGPLAGGGETAGRAGASGRITGMQAQGGPGPEEALQHAILTGTALFRGDKMVGELNARETGGYLFLTGRYRQGIIVLPNPVEKGKEVSVVVREQSGHIKPFLQGNKIGFRVPIVVEADILETEGNTNVTTLSRMAKLERLLEAEVRSMALAALEKARYKYKVDPFGFGEHAREAMPEDKWENFNWLEKYPKAPIRVTAKAFIRRMGMTFAPAVPRR